MLLHLRGESNPGARSGTVSTIEQQKIVKRAQSRLEPKGAYQPASALEARRPYRAGSTVGKIGIGYTT